MNPRDQLAAQLRAEIVRVRYILEHRQLITMTKVDLSEKAQRAENAVNQLDSTAMQRSLETLQAIS